MKMDFSGSMAVKFRGVWRDSNVLEKQWNEEPDELSSSGSVGNYW